MEQSCEWWPQVSAMHGLISIQSDQSQALSALSLQCESQRNCVVQVNYPGLWNAGCKAGFLKLVEVVNMHLSYKCVQE